VTITHSSHVSRHASRSGSALALKNGIMRCDTAANTVVTKHQRATCVAARNTSSWPVTSAPAATHIVAAPTAQASATMPACVRSGTRLARRIVMKHQHSRLQPAATRTMPRPAIAACS
jgi:hypothetical protein